MDSETIENLKYFLQQTKKPRIMKMESYVKRIKILNSCIPLRDIDTTRLTENNSLNKSC